MKQTKKQLLYRVWRILNGLLAAFFFFLIVHAWIEIFYYKNAEKQYYYFATVFMIPLVTCLIVAFGWNLDDV